MDYIVEYSVNGEIKMEVVTFEDFISNDFIEEAIMDELYDLEEFRHDTYDNKSLEIDILHIDSLRDYNVNVYEL